MVLEKLEKLIRARYNKFTFLSIGFFVMILAGIFFAFNFYYDFVLSLILFGLAVGFGIAFGFSLKKMIHYHNKLMEVWDERIIEAKKLKEEAMSKRLGNKK